MYPDNQVNEAITPVSEVASGENLEKIPTADGVVDSLNPEKLVSSSPAGQPNDPAQDDVSTTLTDIGYTQLPTDDNAGEFAKDELPKEIDDTSELNGDEQYISAVKKIIKEDADEPYKEELESEKLQKGYLKDRFGVDVDVEEAQ